MREKIKEVVGALKPELLVRQEDWIANGLISSFDLINLIGNLEEAFGISMEPEDFVPENFDSLDSVIKIVGKYASDE